MRSRDLKKLKPGTKVKITLAKDILLDAPYFKSWTTKPTYFHRPDTVPGWFEIRTSRKLGNSTRIEPFQAKEIQLVKD